MSKSRQGFWVKTSDGGVAHICGDPNMSAESLQAVHAVIEAAKSIPIPPPSWSIQCLDKNNEWYPLVYGSEVRMRRQFEKFAIDSELGRFRLLGSDGNEVSCKGGE